MNVKGPRLPRDSSLLDLAAPPSRADSPHVCPPSVRPQAKPKAG